MFGGSSSFARVVAAFTDQFEQDGAGFLYRRNMRGPAYRVSPAERDTFVANFSRSYRRFFWATMGGTIAVIPAAFATAIWSGISPDTASPLLISGLIVLLIVPFYLAMRRIYDTPSRTLAGQTPVSGALSKTARRDLLFSRVTWGNLAIGAAIFLFLPFQASGWHLLEERNRPWLLLSAAGLFLCAVQAARKWWFERQR